MRNNAGKARMGLCEEISKVIFARDMRHSKLVLLGAILYPMQTHIDRFRHSSLKCVVGKTNSTLIISHNRGRRLRVAHVVEGTTKIASKHTICSTIFRLSRGSNNDGNQRRETEHRMVWKGGLIGNTEKVASTGDAA